MFASLIDWFIDWFIDWLIAIITLFWIVLGELINYDNIDKYSTHT